MGKTLILLIFRVFLVAWVAGFGVGEFTKSVNHKWSSFIISEVADSGS
jgi:hypothetical protein